MTSQGRKIDPKTVDRYLRGLTDSLLFYEARRYNIKGKKLLASMSKYYLCDVALRSLLVRSRDSDIGHTLENVVYLELKRRYPEVLCGGNTAPTVRWTLSPFKTACRFIIKWHRPRWMNRYWARELAPAAPDPRQLPQIPADPGRGLRERMNYDGIEKKNVLKWMLGERPGVEFSPTVSPRIEPDV